MDFGATDEPLKPEILTQDGLVQFPMVIGGVVPVVNVPGIGPGDLKLSGALLRTSISARSTNGTIQPLRSSTPTSSCLPRLSP